MIPASAKCRRRAARAGRSAARRAGALPEHARGRRRLHTHSTYASAWSARAEPIPCALTAMYTYHLGPGGPRVLGAHILEVCPTIAAATPRLEIHPLGIGGREDPVRMVFDAAPGQGLVVGMSGMGDRFRLVANQIEVVPADEPLPNLPVARAVWEPAPDLRTSAESWIMGGGPHHTVLVRGAIGRGLEE